METSESSRALAALDESAGFLAAIILAVLLSFRALLLQREGVCAALEGQEAVPALYPLRHTASAVTVGALAYFLHLAAGTLGGADLCDPAALRSARSNLAAAVLVFAAAAIRFDDVEFLHAAGRLA